MADYWATVARRTMLTRRRALGLAATGLGGWALIAACGGGDDNGAGDKSGLLYDPTKSGEGKPGGTLTIEGTELPSFDPITDQQKNQNSPGTWAYSRMLKWKTYPYPKKASMLDVEGDMMQSWEKTPDGLTYSFKLRPGMKWDNRAPTNGRNVSIEDIKFSWDKYAAQGFTAGNLMQSKNPEAPVVSYSTPDANTIVFNLAYPFTLFESFCASYRECIMIPMEAEDKFDRRAEMRGYGPWMLERYIPSQRFEYVRNPNWYVKDRPFIERVVRVVIPEYSAKISQLRAGQVDFLHEGFTFAVKPEDALSLKDSNPNLNMMLQIPGTGNGSTGVSFDYKPGSIFRDVRVRRAVELLIDKDAYIDAFFNVPAMQAAGLGVEGLWNSHMPAGDPDYWIDPRDTKEFGAGAENFKFDVAEAKALLRAANVPAGYEVPMNVNISGLNVDIATVLSAMFSANGDFKVNLVTVPAAEAAARIFQNGGTNDGFTLNASFLGADFDQQLQLRFVPGAGPTVYYSKTDVPPEFNKYINLIREERKQLNPERRIQMIKKDIQQELAVQMPAAQVPGLAPFLVFAQPWVGGWNAVNSVFVVDPAEKYYNYWIDDSKKS